MPEDEEIEIKVEGDTPLHTAREVPEPKPKKPKTKTLSEADIKLLKQKVERIQSLAAACRGNCKHVWLGEISTLAKELEKLVE